MKKQAVVNDLIKNKSKTPQKNKASAFAPSNIALCKYWGKRNIELNLPVTSSLSMSLDNKGTTTHIMPYDGEEDLITLNGNTVSNNSRFATRLINYLDLFRNKQTFKIDTTSNLPIAAGLASSASGFAALVLALNDLFAWELDKSALSILARLGSGSACRSLWPGFVEWQMGERSDGMDSFAFPLKETWPELSIGLVIIDQKTKSISSRKAMLHTANTSESYKTWPEQVAKDMLTLKQAIKAKDFDLLGSTAENNAIAMHQTIHDSKPRLNYDLPETVALKKRVQQLRTNGLPVYFTQDAGPNLKILYEKPHEANIAAEFALYEVTES